jgi:magnesium-transporting ATPase (P-type)
MKKEDLEKDGDAKWNPQNCQNMEEMNQLKACFNDCLWSEVKCGDLILLEEEENLPADCIFLMSSAENGECFV